jgi:serine/threonine protein kinase
VIGTGGFGTVYRGMHRWLRVPGAIKVIQCEPSDRLRSDFRREAQRQARLQAHPGIAQVRDFGFFTDTRVGAKLPYYVMDLIPGNQSVTRYAHNTELSMNERLRLFAQVCDAVQYAHDRGVLHLDLKPGNILVFPAAEGRPAQPKVIDFGIARAADPAMERRVRRGVSGTISYMSPEQTDASVPLDVRSDVYSLGVVLYELLTGWLPYEVGGRSEREAYRVVRDVPPDFDSPRAAKLPAAIRAILTKAMAKRPRNATNRPPRSHRTSARTCAAVFPKRLARALQRGRGRARAPGLRRTAGSWRPRSSR